MHPTRIAGTGSEQGFTLIELLIVIVILGILSAIALPSFLAQAGKAQEAEGKTIVGTLNRAQQRAYLEKGQFAEEIDDLEIGVPKQTNYYQFAVSVADGTATNKAIAAPGRPNRAYAGVVSVASVNGAPVTVTEVCQSTQRGLAAIGNGTLSADGSRVVCPAGMTPLP